VAALDALKRLRQQGSTPLPGGLDSWLQGWQARRDEKKLRELFPMVVAWSLRPGATADDDVHLFTVSIERLGNRTVLMDWILGFVFSRTPDVDLSVHQGEKIYSFRDSDVAFFLRRSDVVIAGDLETARTAVDRLNAPASRQPGEIDMMLAELPQGRRLRAAISNRSGALPRLANGLAEAPMLRPLQDVPWQSMTAATLAGGFTQAATFETTLTLERSDGEWRFDEAQELARQLAASLGSDRLQVEASARPSGRRLAIDLIFPDLPAQLEDLADRWQEDLEEQVRDAQRQVEAVP
jgi:hypothetical protein